ncbi:hypothetical protein SEUCBS140593_002741 [Sporothrix eucalyptigena]|uniref:Transketolase-like pyrimidine-binding domain-containing protein n=1 Tax=Sporothrix eucalyptigena TaxID=1812306 RepID=A0ABP0B917_9PEZI
MTPSALESNGVSITTKKNVIEVSGKNEKTSVALEGVESHDLVLKTFRLLVADLCQQFNGGHPGGAIGMAAIGVALWKYTMRYAPLQPAWFNRDRFVLSNGHTCLFQYCFLHLTGYRSMTFTQLKSYHSERVDALCPGHPEIEHEGIEVTTGPLGQGVANSVGLAMASKHLAATFNRPGFNVVSNHTWCMVGDACLQEGVALEAISLAGHYRLNNLTIIYDNNQITCDGSVDLTNTENINDKMRACGWNVIDILDGCYDITGLVTAMAAAKHADRPTFINVRTVIGLDSQVAGTADAHGAAFGRDDVAQMKTSYGFDPAQSFVVSPAVRAFFADLPARGDALVQDWQSLVDAYSAEYPELAARFRARMAGEIDLVWTPLVPAKADFPSKPTATRASTGLVFNKIAQAVDTFMVGTADLSPSVYMTWPGKQDFNRPDLMPTKGDPGNYTGRYIHYGIREHAMCAVANGLAAFAPNTIVPVTSSFFMFYLYAAPAVRMGALQHLQVIHVATHDSIGMGEDGPTHQPIELANLYRAMPNLLYIRPADSEETAGAWVAAIQAKKQPVIISTSRHAVPQLAETRRDGVLRGAYVLQEDAEAVLTLIGVGAELSHVVEVAARLRNDHGIATRVVSFPCQRLFEAQPLEYRRQVLQRHRVRAIIAYEPYAPNGWERYANAAASVKRFGHSLPSKAAYKYFGFDATSLLEKTLDYLNRLDADELLAREFVDL